MKSIWSAILIALGLGGIYRLSQNEIDANSGAFFSYEIRNKPGSQTVETNPSVINEQFCVNGWLPEVNGPPHKPNSILWNPRRDEYSVVPTPIN